MSRLAVPASLVVLALFAVLVGFMIYELDADDLRWTRLAWLFAGVEAIAFAAAGALFGSSVQRARAERAEKEADTNKKDAEGGRALARHLKADDPTSPAGGSRLEALGARPDSGAAALAAYHADLARQLFPDV
ncbi:MAG: hypothetical protein M3546_14480 [Actinomycetota bacterium]|nr:hypothetical protein [Actinomycetota bacterium]